MRSLAILVAGILLAPVAASAQKPGRTRAGGLPRCEATLAATQTSLDTCSGDLMACETDLAACEESQVVFPGDGAGHGPPLRYEECADGLTLADLNTGLLWERKVFGPVGCLRHLHNHSPQCTWTEASGAWIDAVNAEGGTGFAGFSDWRLPNVKELQSIVDYPETRDVDFGGQTTVPAIDPRFGPLPEMNPSRCYWSATYTLFIYPNRDPRPPGYRRLAWLVCFDVGGVVYEPISDAAYVRAVRSGSCATP
jgi:hypothetical protein